MSKTLKLSTPNQPASNYQSAAIELVGAAVNGSRTFTIAQMLPDAIKAVGGVPVETTLDAAQAKAGIPVYTAAELRAMLAALEPADVDSTMNLPTGTIPAHLIADKSTLPPVGERTASSIQPPAKLHGRFDINGIPLLASPIGPLPANIDPATGHILAQIMPPRQGGCISPPPTKFFK